MSRRAWLLFAAMVLLWGLPYLLIKVAVGELAPATVVLARTGLATLVLLPIALRRGMLRSLRGRLAPILALSLLEVVVPFLLITYGERYVSSSLAGLLVAGEPLFVALFALRVDTSERVRGPRAAGLALGFAGVAALLGTDVGGDRRQLAGAIAVLAGAACYGAGALLVKRRLADRPPLDVVTASLAVSSLLLAPFALATAPARLPSGTTVLALLLLAVPCTAVAFVLYFELIATAGASRATVVAYCNPAVAAVFGVALLGEPLTASMTAGFLLVTAGSWLATRDAPPAPRAARPGPLRAAAATSGC